MLRVLEKKKRTKYGSRRQKVAGVSYDSTLEIDYHSQLIFMEKAGQISNLEYHCETVYLSDARIGYEPDFTFTEKGRKVYVDTKGVATEVFNIKMRLWRFYGPGPLRIVKRATRGGGFRTTKMIMPVQKEGEE